MPTDTTGFLRARSARTLTAVLLVQAALFYGFSRREVVPATRPLRQVPTQFATWRMVQEGQVEPEVQEVLKANDLLTRLYRDDRTGSAANLFVAYFRSQRTGAAPHSPKNCLPGTGWVPSLSDTLQIPIPGRAEPIEANHYIVARGDNKSVVLYWYQSRDRVVASEYKAKFYAVADAIRYNHTDTALVRVVIPVVNNDESRATAEAVQFVQSSFGALRPFFPA